MSGRCGYFNSIESIIKPNKMKNNKQVNEFCRNHDITFLQFNGKEKISGSLYLSGLTSIPEGFNPTVGDYLDLSGLTSIPEGFNPTVGGDLYLRGLTSIPEGFNPTVGGDLYLRGLTSIPEGFNPTVGDYLDLRGLTSIPEGFNPTVGGSLYLRGLTSIPEGFNPTVGGSLYLSGGLSAPTKKPIEPIVTPKNKLLVWQDGKYVKADGMFTEVISKKGNIYKVKKVHSQKEFYLVTNGSVHSHGDTIQKAKEDFRFKLMADKLKKDPIKEDTIITKHYYRIITGACEFGVQSFIDSHFTGAKKKQVEDRGIKAKDLLPILKKNNAYGFEKFASLITF